MAAILGMRKSAKCLIYYFITSLILFLFVVIVIVIVVFETTGTGRGCQKSNCLFCVYLNFCLICDSIGKWM